MGFVNDYIKYLSVQEKIVINFIIIGINTPLMKLVLDWLDAGFILRLISMILLLLQCGIFIGLNFLSGKLIIKQRKSKRIKRRKASEEDMLYILLVSFSSAITSMVLSLMI